MQRMREIVRPEMQRINDRLAVEVARESKRKGLGYDEYKKELKKQVSRQPLREQSLYGTLEQLMPRCL